MFIQTLPKKTLLTKGRNTMAFNTKFLTLKGPNEKGCGEIAVQMNHRYDTPETEKFNLEDFEWDRAIEVGSRIAKAQLICLNDQIYLIEPIFIPLASFSLKPLFCLLPHFLNSFPQTLATVFSLSLFLSLLSKSKRFKIKTKRKRSKLIRATLNLFSFSCCSSRKSKPLVRRMSDPSYSLVGYISSWKERRMHKSKSESENVDDLGLEFIEAKDINEGKASFTVSI